MRREELYDLLCRRGAHAQDALDAVDEADTRWAAPAETKL